MAKYSRYDPRNKNSHRNKQRSLNKDIRIRHEEYTRNKNKLIPEPTWDNEYVDADEDCE